MANLRQSRPLPPVVKIANPDGTPTREFHQWLSNQYEALTTPTAGSDTAPATATISAVGATNRVVASMSVVPAGQKAPISYAIIANPDNIAVAFSGTSLNTTANPVGAVGDHVLSIRAVDADGRLFSGTLKITLT